MKNVFGVANDFDEATSDFHAQARTLIEDGAPAVIVADAMLTQAMAIWSAETGRSENAADFLKKWVFLRDAQ